MHELKYHESKQRGSPDFPLDYHYIDAEHPRYEMPYHWHEEMEILHILSGHFHLTIGDTLYPLAQDDTVFIPSGTLHGGPPSGCVYECVVFDMRLLLKCGEPCRAYVADVISGHTLVNPLFPADSPVTRHTLLPMFQALREGSDGAALVTLGCLFLFLGQVYQQGAYTQRIVPPGLETRKMLRLKKVFEIIETQYREPLSLASLSQAVNMTPKYFCRFFKQATHRTPMDYLCFFRMEMACYEIAATDKNVTEVAMDTGFTDLNYFIRCFKKQKGMTPKQYMMTLRLEK